MTDPAANTEKLPKVNIAEGTKPPAENIAKDPKVAERDQALERQRGPAVVNNPNAPEAVAKQHEEHDAFMAKRNEENRPGHEKNMEKAEAEAHEAQARTQHADDHRANHVPTGKQNNRNTPRVLKDGTKVWDQ